MDFRIEELKEDNLADVDRLFSCNPSSNGCRCMWFIKPVRHYHQDGPSGNWADFTSLARASTLPMGLIAYHGGQPRGWCAVGPRSRYSRAVNTPTFHGRDSAEDEDIWLVPCIVIDERARGLGLSRPLVANAMKLAQIHGAQAIEAFPYSGSKRRTKDTQVGFESVFATLGFQELSRPSESRVVMRATL